MATNTTGSMLCGVLLVAMAAWVAAGDGGQCGRNPGARLTVSSNYNRSGHWQATVCLENDLLDGQPVRPGRGLLVEVQPSSWRCNDARTDAIVVTLQGPLPPPKPGYQELQGQGFYKIHKTSRNWEDAKAACEEEGTHLLVLNSKEEAEALQKLVKQHQGMSAWPHIGFHDKDKDGNFTTIFGETLADAGFTRWSPGEPNLPDSQHCGGVSKNMGLVDNHCTTQRESFICEQYS